MAKQQVSRQSGGDRVGSSSRSSRDSGPASRKKGSAAGGEPRDAAVVEASARHLDTSEVAGKQQAESSVAAPSEDHIFGLSPNGNGMVGAQPQQADAESPDPELEDPLLEEATGEDVEGERFGAFQLAPDANGQTGDQHYAEVPREPARALRYYVDAISDVGVEGWVMFTTRPSHRCVVGLKEGGTIVARAIASRYRADLQESGVGDGCHSFVLPMPRPYLDGEEHVLEVVEMSTGASLTAKPVVWRSTAGTAGAGLTGSGARIEVPSDLMQRSEMESRESEVFRFPIMSDSPAPAAMRRTGARSGASSDVRVLFDVSDLVYYIGHHPNLTGIQRVQSSIILSVVADAVVPLSSLVLLSFNTRIHRWSSIPTGYFISLLKDLLLAENKRLISFPVMDARLGILPGSTEFDGAGILDDGAPSAFCLLGAAWVQRDYFHRVVDLKRRYGTRVVMTIHDLIPVYARETCDQGTALVFDKFLRRALRHTDHFLAVSESTAKDLRRFTAGLGLPAPSITVTEEGSSFDEFLPKTDGDRNSQWEGLPERYVLFVSTIEGRKNHRLIFNVWRRMAAAGVDVPYLICVGRVGWKSEEFIAELVETRYLDGKVILLKEISDAQLKALYDNCLFTLFPSLYEGWGLPVSESLAAGKVCVCSDRASIPEVAGKFGVYLDINDTDACLGTIRRLVTDSAHLAKLESNIRKGFKPITWGTVAKRIVEGCRTVAKLPPASPYVTIPYSTEVSFAAAPVVEADGIFGEDLVARVMETRKGLFLSEPLQLENFLRGEEARSGPNWAEPENWGTWSCHSGGELVFDLGPSQTDVYYVYLRLRASGPLSELQVRISANGEFLWGERIGNKSRDIMVRIRRRGGTAAGWRMRLRAEANLSSELRDRLAAVDGRVPTIGFERMLVVPDDDVKTRIDILSRFVIGDGTARLAL